MASAASFRVGATYSMKAIVNGKRTTSENRQPIANANDNPSNRMRRQFHSTTSRGAYNVCATAIAVNTAPKVPQAAPISGCVIQRVLFRRIKGEKQYNTKA